METVPNNLVEADPNGGAMPLADGGALPAADGNGTTAPAGAGFLLEEEIGQSIASTLRALRRDRT